MNIKISRRRDCKHDFESAEYDARCTKCGCHMDDLGNKETLKFQYRLYKEFENRYLKGGAK